MVLTESSSRGESKKHHRIEMKPTPTHPVPDLDRTLETPPLCAKGFLDIYKNKAKGCVQRKEMCMIRCCHGNLVGVPLQLCWRM